MQEEKGNFAITKGALNTILEICDRAETQKGELIPMSDKRQQIIEQYQQFSASGYWVLRIKIRLKSMISERKKRRT